MYARLTLKLHSLSPLLPSQITIGAPMIFNRLEHGLKIEEQLILEKQWPRHSQIIGPFVRFLARLQVLRAANWDQHDGQSLKTMSQETFADILRNM